MGSKKCAFENVEAFFKLTMKKKKIWLQAKWELVKVITRKRGAECPIEGLFDNIRDSTCIVYEDGRLLEKCKEDWSESREGWEYNDGKVPGKFKSINKSTNQ